MTANIAKININKVQYNVAHISASDQKKLLSLIGGKVAFNSASAQAEKIDTQLLFGALITLPEDKFDEIASLVLQQAFINGTDTPLDVGDFQNKINDYFLLVAEAIQENLADFFTYLDTINAQTRSAEKQQ